MDLFLEVDMILSYMTKPTKETSITRTSVKLIRTKSIIRVTRSLGRGSMEVQQETSSLKSESGRCMEWNGNEDAKTGEFQDNTTWITEV